MKKYLIKKLKELRQIFSDKGDIPQYHVEMKKIKVVCSNCMREVKDCICYKNTEL